MKLEVYAKSPPEPVEEIVRLRLVPSYARGSISLVLVDKSGIRLPSGAILSINPDGTFRRFVCVNNLMSKDSQGRIKESGL